jgi:hypothetical protein
MNKNCSMADGICVQMVELETIEIKEAPEEVATREGQWRSGKCRKSIDSSMSSKGDESVPARRHSTVSLL